MRAPDDATRATGPHFGVVAFGVGVFVVTAFATGSLSSPPDVRALADAASYLDLGEWLLGLRDDRPAFFLSIRPWGYPVLATAAQRWLPGGVVAVQVLAWSVTGALIASTIQRCTGRRSLARACGIGFHLLVTPLLLLWHALSEVVAIFLFTASLWALARYADRGRLGDAIAAVLCGCGFVLVRPLVHLLVVLLVVVAASTPWRRWPALALATVPVLSQVVLMQLSFGTTSLSFIGPLAVNTYFLARVDVMEDGGELRAAIENRRRSIGRALHGGVHGGGLDPVGASIMRDLAETVVRAPRAVARAYLANLAEALSVGALPIIVGRPDGGGGVSRALRSLSRLQALVLAGGGLVLAAIVVPYLRLLGPVPVFASLSVLYLVAISGLSFWQGDRLLLPAYPAAIVLGALVWARLRERPAPLPAAPPPVS